MSSNYDHPSALETVREAENWEGDWTSDDDYPGSLAVETEKICPRCHGLGEVILHGQETDCLDCEGMGSVLI